MTTLPLFPMLVLELQSHCNRECSFCARTHDRSGARKDAGGVPVRKSMPTDQVLRLLGEAHALGFRGATTFYLYSEPFLDPRLITIAGRAKDLGMYTFVNTNGDVLRKDAALRREAAKVFRHIEVGLYEAVTESEFKEQSAWWKSNLPTNVVFAPLARMGARPGNKMAQPIDYSGSACVRPAEKCIITYDGRSPICCYDIRCEWPIPNAFESSLKDVWWNAERTLTADVLKKPGGRATYNLCSTCCMPPSCPPTPVGWDKAPSLKRKP